MIKSVKYGYYFVFSDSDTNVYVRRDRLLLQPPTILSLLSMATILCFQTKLHDGVCQKRQAATKATHDLKSVKYGYYFVFSDKVTRWCVSEETGCYYSHP